MKHWKDPEYIKLIHSSRWQSVRINHLQHFPICQRCAEHNKTTVATEVHHITPISQGFNFAHKEALAFTDSNLMSLCHDCHKAMHEHNGWHQGNKKYFTKAENKQRIKDNASAFVGRWMKQEGGSPFNDGGGQN